MVSPLKICPKLAKFHIPWALWNLRLRDRGLGCLMAPRTKDTMQARTTQACVRCYGTPNFTPILLQF